MAIYSLRAVQLIPVTVSEAWAFFSNPARLKDITPGFMRFTVLSPPVEGNMYPGQLIEYTVRPLLGIPVYWMTEITHVQPEQYFIDEQRYGPYSFWHHQHHFKPVPGGVEMTDLVHYKMPAWLIGRLMNRLIVQQKLADIFHYRFHQIELLLGKWPGQSPNIVFRNKKG